MPNDFKKLQVNHQVYLNNELKDFSKVEVVIIDDRVQTAKDSITIMRISSLNSPMRQSSPNERY